MKKELLSPAGNKECLYAAVKNGADSVYISGKLFGARKFAENFTNEELKEAVYYSHLYGVKVYVTVNTIIYNNEVKDFLEYIDYLYTIGVDALIMQDIGMISLVRSLYKDFEINASTQLHNHNNYSIKLFKDLNINKVVLDRELSILEIEKLDNTIEKEVFIHGALCNSYSGCCLFSSLNGGRSGNRGECVGSCRLPYKLIKNGKYIETNNKYLLSTKELNTTSKTKELMESDISTFKIEGRMKSPAYVGYLTRIYKRLIDNYYNNKSIELTKEEENNLKILFNREFTTGYLFNDNIMNKKSSNHKGLLIGKTCSVNKNKIKIKLEEDLYQEDGIRFIKSSLGMIANRIYNKEGKLINKASKGDIIYLDNKINLLKEDLVYKTSSNYLEKQILNKEDKKIPISIYMTNNIITFIDDKNNKVSLNIKIDKAINRATTKEEIIEKLSKLGNTVFEVNNINIDIPDNIFINMKDLNEIRRCLTDLLIKERTKINRNSKLNNIDIISKTNNKNNKIEFSFLARNKNQIELLLKENIDRIYVDYDLYKEYSNYNNIFLRLPRVSNNYDIECNNVLVTELGGVEKYRNSNMITDYYLNVVNNYSIKYLLDKGVKKVTLSPEINYNDIKDFNLDNIELIIYGKLELMITKSKLIDCSLKDEVFLEDIYKNKYKVIYKDNLTHIMHYKNIDYLDNINYYIENGVKSFRIELLDEDEEQIKQIINKISKNNSI